MQLPGANLLRELGTKFFSLDQHLHQAPLGGLPGAAHQLRPCLHFTAAFVCRLAHRFTQHRLLDAKLLRDACGPFRAQNAIGNALDVGHQRIHRAQLSFGGGQVHLAGARDQIIHVRWRFVQQFRVRRGALGTDETVRVLAAGQGKDAHLDALLEQNRKRTLGGGLPRRVGIVVDDDAPREAIQELHLRFGKACAAARDHIRDSRERHRNRVHVAFNQHGEVQLPQRFLCAVQMVENVALRIDRRLGRVQIFRQVIAQSAPSERHNLSRFVGNGKHDAPAESVVEPLALIAAEQAGNLEHLLRMFLLHHSQQCFST